MEIEYKGTNLVYNKDGSIDWDKYYNIPDSAKRQKAGSTILENPMEHYQRVSRRRRERAQLEEDSYSPPEETVVSNKINTKTKDNSKPSKKIPRKLSKVSKELKESPYLKNEIIDKLVRWDDSNSAQRLNTRGWYNIYGKLTVRSCGNTYTGDRIASIRPWHFGSIEARYLEAVPESIFKLKGTEITKVSSKGLKHRGKALLRRGFLTTILKKWSYVVGIKYIVTRKDDNGIRHLEDVNGIRYWALQVENSLGGIDFYITGKQAVMMLKDFLYLIRDKSMNKLEEYASKGKISNQLYNIIEARAIDEDKSIKDVLTDIRARLYYDCTIEDENGEPRYIWSFPKLNVTYLLKVIRDLSSNRYYTSIYLPLIKNTRLYPIKCSDTRVYPMSNEEHREHKDDYDILSSTINHDSRGAGN